MRAATTATLSTSFYHAYHIARAFATLDHISHGRAGWNIVTSGHPAEARNYGFMDGLKDRESRYDFADEVLEEEKAAEQALACLRSLKAQDPKSEVAALRARIKAAERDGNLDEAMRLAEELDRRSRRETSHQL